MNQYYQPPQISTFLNESSTLISPQSRKNENIIFIMKLVSFYAISILIPLIIILSTQRNEVIRIPFTYVYDWDLIAKLPVTLAFNHSSVFSTSPTDNLNMMNYKLPVNIQSFPEHQQRNKVEIGLQYPSDFIVALSKLFGVSYEEIQFEKDEYLQIIIFDDNFVENRDIFVNHAKYKIHVKYNFGTDYFLTDKLCDLIDGSEVYFEEFLIRQALNQMTNQNKINFKFNQQNHTISLSGQVQNLPKLTLVKDDYIFKIKLKGSSINYIPALKNPQSKTLIGYKALYQFNKFKFTENGQVIFKRTSLIYQLYLFLLYFVLLSLFLVYVSRRNLYDTGIFVKHILKWALFKDRTSRIEVLRSELQ